MIVHHGYRLSLSRNRATIKTQQYLCCENCGGAHENFQYQPRNQNYFESNPCYNPNSYGFDQPTQTSIDHLPPKEMSVRELLLPEKLHKVLQAVCEKLNQQVHASNVSTHTPGPSRRFNIIYDYDNDDDDDEESTIPLNEIISQIPSSIAITPVLPTMEPEDSLIMGGENLSTIPEKEPDEFIKSSVEDLVPIPSESEDTSDSDRGDIADIVALDIDVSTDFEDDYYDSEGDIIYLESLLINDTIPNLFPEVFLDHDPKSIKDEPDNNNLKSMVKVFDPEIHKKIISPTYVRLPFEDRHYFSLTFVIRIFLPYLTYSMDPSLLLSSGNEDTIFDPGISVFSCYSLEPVRSHRSGTFMCFNVYLNILNGSPMVICSSTCFVPNITMIWGKSS
ncbi:hypothetical protein Tco_0765494 [Tanacetum coccineum]